jgi:hypothetical protein
MVLLLDHKNATVKSEVAFIAHQLIAFSCSKPLPDNQILKTQPRIIGPSAQNRNSWHSKRADGWRGLHL